MELIGTLQQPPARADAEAFLARLVSAGPARLSWFLDQVEALTGTRPAPSVTGITTVVPAVVSRLHADDTPGGGPRPEWFTTDVERATGWTPYGAALADGFLYLVAELYRRELGATWVLNTDPRHADFHQPVMSVRLATPPQRFLSTLVRIERGKDPVDRVEHAFESILTHARAELAAGGPGDIVLEIGVTPLDPRTGFTHQVWLDENAESVLGRVAFDSLVQRLAEVPGVQDVLHEDREIFLLRAPGVRVEELDRAVRTLIAGPARS